MFKPSYILLLAPLFFLETFTYYDQCKTKGKILPDNERTQLINCQKKIAWTQTPHHIHQQIQRLQNHPIIYQNTQLLKNKDEHAITWNQLEKKIAKQKSKCFSLFAFGSLINARSTLNAQCQPNINIPGIVFGVKRIYGMTHPDPEASCMGLPTHGHEDEQLRLDTHITGNIANFANGILLKFTLDTPQYAYLKHRERKYSLVPVKVVDYRSLSVNPRFYDAYILCGTDSLHDCAKKPHIVYNSIVIDGAQQIEHQGNPGFLSLLLDTTYLPDGITTLRTWIIDK